jgi:hypothetical protein
MVRRDVSAASEPIDDLLGRYPGALRLIHVTGTGVLIFEVDRRALGPEAGEVAGGWQ